MTDINATNRYPTDKCTYNARIKSFEVVDKLSFLNGTSRLMFVHLYIIHISQFLSMIHRPVCHVQFTHALLELPHPTCMLPPAAVLKITIKILPVICSNKQFWHKTNIQSLNFHPTCPITLNKKKFGARPLTGGYYVVIRFHLNAVICLVSIICCIYVLYLCFFLHFVFVLIHYSHYFGVHV